MTDEIQQPAEDSQVIEPQTGVIDTTELDAAGQQPPRDFDNLYTLLDDGTYQPQMDILYPAGTKFYYKTAEDTYVDAGIEIAPDVVENTQPEITEEFILSKATEFMEARGYTIYAPGAAPNDSAQVNDLKSQVSVLRDELIQYRKPTSEVSVAKIEIGMLFQKLRSMVSSHFPARHLIDEAHSIIAKIEEKL